MSFSLQQCAGLQALQYDLNFMDRYDEFFSENSTMILSQAGVYTGPDQMAEYFGFTQVQRSPYMAFGIGTNRSGDIVAFDPVNGLCTYLLFDNVYYEMDPENSAGYSVHAAAMSKHIYSIPENKVHHVYWYFTTEWLVWFFGTALGQGDNTNGYVCDVMASEGCRDIYELNGSPSRESCIEQLNALDIAEGNLAYVDSKTRGCRYLHATFAQNNSDHCAHLSFTPAQDPNGKIKCQESSGITPDSLFSAQEIAVFEKFCIDQPNLNSSTECMLVVGEPNITTDSPTMSPTDDTSSGAAFLGHTSPIGLLIVLVTMGIFSVKL